MATLTIGSSGFVDFTQPPRRALVDLLNITEIQFSALAGDFTFATFASDQIGSPDISQTVNIIGRPADGDGIGILPASLGPMNISLAGWTFQNGFDRIEITMTDFADVVVGSSVSDIAIRPSAGDQISLGAGDDTFQVIGSSVVLDGALLDGGEGADVVAVLGTVDFRGATLTAIEQVSLATGATAFFAGHQFGFGGISNLHSPGSGGRTVVVEGSSVVLAGVAVTGVTEQMSIVITDSSDNNSALIGSTSNDFILGGAGDDRLDGFIGADYLDGGDGVDFATYNLRTSVFASLELGFGFGGDATGDVYVGIEGLEGSSFQDFLGGDANANTLRGLGGDDIILGGDGGDVIEGGAGNDFLFGEGGVDIISGGAGNDYIDGGGSGSQLSGGAGFDAFVTNGFNAANYDLRGDVEAGVFETVAGFFVGQFILPMSLSGTVSVIDTVNGVFAFAPVGDSFWGFIVTNTHDVHGVQTSIAFL